MIFNILIIAAVAGIAYFHYAQGFFSATLSTICAIIAAVLAVSYHETLVVTLLGGKMADYANSVCLVAIFGVVYILLRTLMDKAVPGNIRLPVIVDRVGGAVLGIIAALFTAGVFALAGAALPFGPGVYARFPLESREQVTIPPNPGQSVQTTADVNDQMASDTFEGSGKGLWIPADDVLLAAVQGLSNGGSLAGSQTLKSIHPNYADELFAQRLGIQVGANHVATNLASKISVSVPDPGVFRIDNDLNKSLVDAELPQLHQRAISKVAGAEPEDKMQLVVRVLFNQGAADPDRIVRLAPASIRLVANERNYYPVGTLENGLLYANKVDDFLILNLKDKDGGADFVFMVNPSDVASGDPKAKTQKINDGVFLEAKRLARIDLSGKEIQAAVPPLGDNNRIERKPQVGKSKGKGESASSSGGSEGGAAAAAASGPFVYNTIAVSKQLFSPINTGTADKDVKDQTIPSGSVSLQSGQFTKLDINTTQTLTLLRQGSYAISELFEPTGKKLVQVLGTPPPEGGDPWAWGALRNFTLVDAAGKTYAPCGGWAQVKKDQQDRMVAKFDANASQPPDVTGSPEDGRPLKVWIAFMIPSGTHLKSLNYNGQPLKAMEQMVQ